MNDQNVDQQINNQSNNIENQNNFVEVKNSQRKKKIILILIAALIFICLLIGGLYAFNVLNEQDNGTKIKIPINYNQYKPQILIGQEKNLISIINVPKSQKIYKYLSTTTITNTQADGQIAVTRTVSEHDFGLVCSELTEEYFEMLVYIKKTQNYDLDDKEKSLKERVGFPEMLTNPDKEDQNRNMVQEKPIIQQNNERLLQEPEEEGQEDIKDPEEEKMKQRIREKQKQQEKESGGLTTEKRIGLLTPKEIEALKKKGYTDEQYKNSKYPIIKFRISKEGKITQVFQPINLRYDVYQIYINLLEQISPIVKADLYQVQQKDQNGKKRILSYQKIFEKIRILGIEDIQPQYSAQVQPNGEGTLNKEYAQGKSIGENSERQVSYDQQSKIQNGALLESKASSSCSFDDNKNGQNKDPSLTGKMDIKTDVVLSFVKQEDKMEDKFFNQLMEYFKNMSSWNYTWEQAKNEHQASLEKTQNGPDDKQNLRELADEQDFDEKAEGKQKPMGDIIQKPIFRKTLSSFELGADIRSECTSSESYSKQDICKASLWSYFNGVTAKLIERKTRINVSKLIKQYQYIQHLFQTKLNIVKDDILGGITKVQDNINNIIDQVEDFLDIKRNPVMKELLGVVYNDELNVVSQINQFELLINKTLEGINKLVENPLAVFKEKTISFLARKYVSLSAQINSISNFFIDKFTRIQKYIEKNKNYGISEDTYQKLVDLFNTYEDIIIELVEVPIKGYLDEVESFVLSQASSVFDRSSEVDKQVSDTQESKEGKSAKLLNLIKKMLTTSGLVDKLKKMLVQGLKRVVSQKKVAQHLIQQLNSNLKQIKDAVLVQMEIIPQNNRQIDVEEIQQVLLEFNNSFYFSQDIKTGIQIFKDDCTQIIDSLKNLQGKKALKVIGEFAANLVSFPTDLAKKVKYQGLETIRKIKNIALKIKENVINWKDQIIQQSKDLVSNVKGIFASVKELFSKPVDFPMDNQSYYDTPIFDEVMNIVNGVKSVINYPYKKIGQIFIRILDLPNKFKIFLTQMKDFGNQTFEYLKNIKLAVSSMNIDGGLIWQKLSGKVEQSRKEVKGEIEEKQPDAGAKGRRVRVLGIFDREDETDNSTLNQNYGQAEKAISEFNDANQLDVKNNVESYKKQCEENAENSGQLYSGVIGQIISQIQFETRIQFQAISLDWEYTQYYVTPIGITLVFKIYAGWRVGFIFTIKFKNAILDISVGVNTYVVAGGSIGISILIAEFGAYLEGKFLDTTLTVGIALKVLERFKGCVYIDAQFTPITIRFGIYYKILFFSRQDLFEPIQWTGPSYYKRLSEYCW